MCSELANVLYPREFHAHTMKTLRLGLSPFSERVVANTPTTVRDIHPLRWWLVALTTVLAALTFSVQATECSADPGGNPNHPGQCASVGNPINVMTGNKYQREEDMPALPGVLGLEIVRHYNSAFSSPDHPSGPLGRGWRLSYETEVIERWGKIQVLLADGGRVIFDRDVRNPTGCSTIDPANGRMAVGRQQDGQSDYTWTWTDGRKLHFNAAGKLDRITALTGETLRLLYDSQNVLVRVTDPQGRSLNLVYYDRHVPNQFHGVQFIDTPVGRFAYEYGSTVPKGTGLFDQRQLLARLVRVRLPDHFAPATKAHELSSRGTTRSTTSRFYHHEDPRSPWLMTGISIETVGEHGKLATARYATYGYDDTGRAILSTHAGNVGKVTLDNHEAGKTVLTNSLGQKTVYRYEVIAGEYRLLEVRGAGCALCGEPNVRNGYDSVGRLAETTKLSENGEPVMTTRVERDKLGRVTRFGKVVYQKGKPGPWQLQARFEYQGAGFAPALVARPSVVPGNELVTRIDYNEAGQPLSVTETGWAPTADGKHAAERIERTIRYRYATINGRSLLTEIDGPLPNGKTNSPADSDVTVFEYDRRPAPAAGLAVKGLVEYERREGLLTRVIAPGNLVTEVLERDMALRPNRLRTTDGDLVQDINMASNWRGGPLSFELTAGNLRRKVGYEYDALGQIAAIIMPGNLRTTFKHDSAGRTTLTALPDGSGIRNELDTEDRVVRTTRLLDALATSGTGLAEQRFTYDHQTDRPGKLAEVGDAAGLLKRYSYDELGLISTVRSALGFTSAFTYNADSLLTSRTDAAGSDDAAGVALAYDPVGHATGITAGNGVKTLRRYDDFGRKVMDADPDRGITIFRHDAAGHMVARIDETMTTTRFTYDNAGRLMATGADDKPDLVQYRYRGRQLQSVISTPDGKSEHAAERTDYQRDALGRVTKETRWLINVTPRTGAPAGFSFVTTSEYDAAGQLVNQTLPDGHRLHYRYVSSDVNKAGDGRPGQLESILFDDDIIMTDITQTIASGLTGYTMGNGARQLISLDSRGRVEQLQVLGAGVGPASWWRRITAWFSDSKENGVTLFYRQVNRYDADGRITRIDRQIPSAELGRGQITSSDTYGYDQMNRLTDIRSSDGKKTRFAYDKGGNRSVEMVGPTQAGALRAATSDAVAGHQVNRYAYAAGSNRLIGITSNSLDLGFAEPSKPPAGAQWARHAWFYHSTGLPLAQLMWTEGGERASRRVVYNSNKRPIAVYANAQLLARYHYSAQGERIAKTLSAPRRLLTAVSHEEISTTYFLYHDQRLAAEADGAGRITAHYVYLYGKPVAKIEMLPRESWLHRIWKMIAECATANSNDTEGQIYSIVTDHLGTPQEVMDKQLRMVWQASTSAFGETHITYAAVIGKNRQIFVMNLRLPGQLYDAETGLSQNLYRDYDPKSGRYTTPDPIGLPGGINPYVYVSNDPMGRSDPFGLYEIDVHYYVTYTLAILAGMPELAARQLALATQYVDDNPYTTPIPESKIAPIYRGIWTQTERLKRYHFTQAGYDRAQQLGESDADYVLHRVDRPWNPQLQLLLNAANNPNNRPCAKLVLFGEYLHAYEDTFGHRDQVDEPINVNGGAGHLVYGHEADKTYNAYAVYENNPVYYLAKGDWLFRQSRTLEMEQEVFDEIQKEFHVTTKDQYGRPITFARIQNTLALFNSINESEGENPDFISKLGILQGLLHSNGFRDFDFTGYSVYYACNNRYEAVQGLKQSDYAGTILSTPQFCRTDRPQ
jgi:RHS repeat-associated protein